MNNNTEEPDAKKRKSTTHSDTIFKTDVGCGDMDSLDNDIVVRFASYLCPRDLVNLSLTCRRYGSSNDVLSLMEDTARHIICNAQQDEKEALPKLANQTYIELYSELEKYRRPRIFDQLIGKRISYVGNDKSIADCSTEDTASTAICNHVMRAGKHYVTFTILEHEIHEDLGESSMIYLGIVRPLPNWDKKGLDRFDPLSCHQNYEGMLRERTDRWGDSTVHHCAIVSRGGYCWSDWVERYEFDNWDEHEEDFFGKGDVIGMLLDLEAGTLSVYRNGRRLGVMKDDLSGDYCWSATLWSHGDCVRIEKGVIPTD